MAVKITSVLLSLILVHMVAISALQSNRKALDERLSNFHGFYASQVEKISDAGTTTKDAVDSVSTELQSLLQMVVGELSSMDEVNDALQAKNKNLTDVTLEQQQTIASKNGEISQLQKKNSELKNVNEELKESAENAEKENKKCEVENHNLKEAVKDLEITGKETVDLAENLNSTITQINEENKRLENQVHQLKEQGIADGAEKAKLVERVNKLQSKVNDLSKQINENHQTVASKNAIIQQLQNKIKELENNGGAKIAELKNELQSAKTTIAGLRAEIKKIKIELETSHGGYEMVNGRYVKFHNTKLSWMDAKQVCKNASSELIMAKDEKTQDWIKHRYTPMWIGAHDFGHEGEWTWVDGSPVVDGKWNSGEPNNGLGMFEENCVAANFRTVPWWSYGKWADRSCEKLVKFACEIPNYP